MNWKQFKDAEEEIKSASGSKSISFGRVAQRRSQQQTAEGGEDRRKWMKSSTPYRFSLKQASKNRGIVVKAKPAMEHCDMPSDAGSVKVLLTKHNAVHWLCRHFAADDEAQSLSSLPLPTIEVRWQLKLTFPPFTLSELRFVMSGFGKIVSVRRLEVNSALVVFRNLQSARRAVNSKRLGQTICRLSCRWFYPVLAQPNIFAAINGQPKVSPPLHSINDQPKVPTPLHSCQGGAAAVAAAT